jgi:hypothetical protein
MQQRVFPCVPVPRSVVSLQTLCLLPMTRVTARLPLAHPIYSVFFCYSRAERVDSYGLLAHFAGPVAAFKSRTTPRATNPRGEQ